MIRLRFVFFLFTAILFAALLIMPAAAFIDASTPEAASTKQNAHPLPTQGNNTKQVQLLTVLIPGLSLQDLPQCPTLTRLAREGAVGLLNTQHNGTRRLSAAYLTIAAGKKAACTEEAARAWQREEKIQELTAAEFYQRYTGISANSETVFLPYLQQLQNINPSEVRPGLLGETLEQNQLPVLLVGNHDLPEKTARPGALLAMNSEGVVRSGIIDRRTYIVSPFSPTVYTTNYEFLAEQTSQFLQQNEAGLVLLDLGDLSRLDALTTALSPAVYLENRQKLLAGIDAFLGSLQQMVTETGAEKERALLVLAPYPAKAEVSAGNTLTPIIYYRQKMPGNELLLSASTKRKGLLTNLDLAPTILTHWQIDYAPFFSGHPFFTTPHAGPLTFLNEQLALFQVNHSQRPLLIKGYVLLLIILVLAILLLLLLSKTGQKLYRALITLLLALTSVPLLFLLLPLLPTDRLEIRTIALLAGVTLAVKLFRRQDTVLPRLTLLYLLTTLGIVTDLLLGAPLMKSSILGYDPISGARFYGLGNEYLGVLLGSSVLGSTLLLEMVKEKRGAGLSKQLVPLTGIGAFFLIFLVAAPQWGTNVGGTITFLTSYLLLYALFYRQKISLRLITACGAITLLFLIGLFAWDLQRPLEAQSHIGQTARLIGAEGPASLLPIFARKINMNIKLIRYSMWSRVFLTFLAALALVFNKPPGLLKKLFGEYGYLQAGLYTGLAGSLIVLFVNDSGIVAAGTSMLFITPALLYLVSVLQQQPGNNSSRPYA